MKESISATASLFCGPALWLPRSGLASSRLVSVRSPLFSTQRTSRIRLDPKERSSSQHAYLSLIGAPCLRSGRQVPASPDEDLFQPKTTLALPCGSFLVPRRSRQFRSSEIKDLLFHQQIIPRIYREHQDTASLSKVSSTALLSYKHTALCPVNVACTIGSHFVSTLRAQQDHEYDLRPTLTT